MSEMPTLVPCPACARHARADARRCPFCGADPSASAPGPVRLVARSELTRFAVVAGAAMLAAACSGSGETEQGGSSDGSSGAEDEYEHRRTGERHIECDDPPCPAPPYGAPAIDERWV